MTCSYTHTLQDAGAGRAEGEKVVCYVRNTNGGLILNLWCRRLLCTEARGWERERENSSGTALVQEQFKLHARIDLSPASLLQIVYTKVSFRVRKKPVSL